jgi:hypothetical protein
VVPAVFSIFLANRKEEEKLNMLWIIYELRTRKTGISSFVNVLDP